MLNQNIDMQSEHQHDDKCKTFLNLSEFAAIERLHIRVIESEIEITVEQIPYSSYAHQRLTFTQDPENWALQKANPHRVRFLGWGTAQEVETERTRKKTLLEACWPTVNPNSIGNTLCYDYIFKGKKGDKLDRFLEATVVFDPTFIEIKNQVQTYINNIPGLDTNEKVIEEQYKAVVHQYKNRFSLRDENELKEEALQEKKKAKP